jgi:hypothetical protein
MKTTKNRINDLKTKDPRPENFMKKNKPKNNTIKSEETTIEPPVYAVMKVAVFPRGTGLYSEYLTEVEFVDEGGDGYIQITQENRFIKLDLDEWPVLQAAVEVIARNNPLTQKKE